jgi:hypothetical protein
LRYREGIELRRNYSDRYTYVVSPADDEFQYRLGRKVWECRKAIWIPFDAETFFGRLNFILKTQTDKEMRELIKYKYGFHTDEEYHDKVKHAAELLHVEEADAVQYLAEAATKTGKSS